MRIVFSRKGFDSSYGGAPSPIIGGRPISLPIPEDSPSVTTYEALGLGETVEQVTRGRIARHATCHDDPMFAEGYCWLGQAGSAQGHLRNNHVGQGDSFLFFGLFADPETGERHHRLFGFMQVACCGTPDELRRHPSWREPPRSHPHLSPRERPGNTLYFGRGAPAQTASPALRLTRPEGPLTRWSVPSWLALRGLTYHSDPRRWIGPTELEAARRGQEFVCDIGEEAEPRQWLERIIAAIEG
jgi:hypothetical protein